MSNLNQLEREWRAYKRRERRPFIITLIIIIPLMIGLIFFILKDKPSDAPALAKQLPTKVSPIITKELPTKRVITDFNDTKAIVKTKELPSSIQELRPSFTFIKQIKETKVKKTIRHKNVKHTPKKAIKREKTYEEEASHNQVAVSSASAQNKIDALAKRFNSNRNPVLGIAVAKQYLKNRHYKQAYFYALEVNNIDRRNEESWLVSAQALYHLKDKVAALKLLKIYLQKNSSTKAQRLYQAIKRDRLK